VEGAMIKKVVDNAPVQGRRYRIFAMYKGEYSSVLFVPFHELEAAKLYPHDFSDKSLIDETGMYLDEEEDSQTFIDAYPQHTGYHVVLNEEDEAFMPRTKKEKNKVPISQKYWANRPKKSLRIVD
jgi:hypothetical protein